MQSRAPPPQQDRTGPTQCLGPKGAVGPGAPWGRGRIQIHREPLPSPGKGSPVGESPLCKLPDLIGPGVAQEAMTKEGGSEYLASPSQAGGGNL